MDKKLLAFLFLIALSTSAGADEKASIDAATAQVAQSLDAAALWRTSLELSFAGKTLDARVMVHDSVARAKLGDGIH